MKIAFFHELHAGGARRAVNEFARHLKKDHQVDVFIVDEKDDNTERKFFNNIHYYNFTPKKWKGGDWKTRLYKDSIELYKLYRLHKKIAMEINKKRYDVVIVYPSRFTQAPFLLKFLSLKKLYFCMEPLRLVYDSAIIIPKNLGFFRYLYEKINRLVRKELDKQNVSYAQICIAPSKYLASLFSEIYNKTVKTVYCGVDVEFFINTQIKKNIDILFVGSKSYYDGYPFLKEILKYVKTNIKMIEVLSENEWLTDIQIRDIFRRSKILLAISHNEPLGLVPLEAMSCGVAVVAIDEAGYKETIINGRTGYLMPRDPQKIAQKLDWLLSHQDELTSLSSNGRKMMVNNWTWQACSKSLENLIKQYIFK